MVNKLKILLILFAPLIVRGANLQPQAQSPMTITVPQNGNVSGITINQNDTINNSPGLTVNGPTQLNGICTGIGCGSSGGTSLPFPAGATNYAQINPSSQQVGAINVQSSTFSTVQVTSNTILSGATFYQGGQFNLSDFTNVSSSITFTDVAGLHNPLQGLIDIFLQNDYIGKPFITMGSNNQSNQIKFSSQSPLVLGYGMTAGQETVGASGSASRITNSNSSSQYVDFWDAQTYLTLQSYNFGANTAIIFKPNAVDTVDISTYVVAIKGPPFQITNLTANASICTDGSKYLTNSCGTSGGSGAEQTISYQPGLLSAVNATKGVFGKFVKASTVDNIEGSAITFSCVANPTITLYECGTSASCSASPTTIGTVTVTSAGTVVDGTISNSSIIAGDYIAWSITSGTCASIDISATAQVHAN